MQILLIGCGKMGSAMLSAWLDNGIVTRATIVDRHPNDTARRFDAHEKQIEVYADVSALPADITPALVILAVKPQQMAAMLAELAPRLKPEWPVMTIAAGLRSEFYLHHLPQNPIIRVMPNTPVIVGKGMTIATAVGYLNTALRTMVEKLLHATGDFLWLNTEDQLDAAMAISASGPGYFFYFAEQLAKAGEAYGLTPKQTMRLARQTLIGVGAMTEAQTGAQLTELREGSLTQGGVTIAALQAWDKEGAFPDLIAAGIAANIARSQALAKL
jgi:pyrroline-5-carboxylate reductase